MPYLLGIDSGTSSVKTAVIDPERGIIDTASRECRPVYSHGFVEINMNVYWEAVKSCVSELNARNPGIIGQIRAVSVSSQGVTFTAVDKLGKDLGNAIFAYDERAKKEGREIVSRFGAQKIFEVTGQPVVSETFEAPKLLWLRKNEPERFGAINKILLVHDYLIYKLTGRFVSVPSILSSSLLFDVKKRVWWDEMLVSWFDVPEEEKPAEEEGGEAADSDSAPEIKAEA